MKGIILAGGNGSRLYPLTKATSKQLLPIYDKPLIYYPLSVLMQSGIQDVLIISKPDDIPRFQCLFGDGSNLGMSFSYAVQQSPRGIAEAFIIGESFIGKDDVMLVLGDNIFYDGSRLPTVLKQYVASPIRGGIVFGCSVLDPERYGVLSFQDNRIVDIIEKPKRPPSSYAVTGLYVYDQDVVSIAKSLSPSERGELEITDVNRIYLNNNNLKVHLFEKEAIWLDAGTLESLYQASECIRSIQEHQSIQIACIEGEAYRNGWISDEQLMSIAVSFQGSYYGDYLQSLIGHISQTR